MLTLNVLLNIKESLKVVYMQNKNSSDKFDIKDGAF